MSELEIRKLILERTRETTDRLVNSAQSFWNALLTINGLFLSFFTFFTDKINIPQFLIIIYGVVTALPVMVVLYLTWLDKVIKIEIFNLSAIESKNLIDSITNNCNNTNHENKKRKFKKRIIFLSVLNKGFEHIAIICTVIAVVLIFYLGLKF